MASRLATGSEDDIFATNSWSCCTNKYKKKSDELWLVGNYGLTKFFTKLGQRTREVLVAPHVAAGPGRDHHVSMYWGLGGERSASPREWRPRRQNLTLAPCKGFQDSLGFWIQCRGFRIPGTGFQSSSVELGILIPIILGFQIPWAVFRIPKPRIPPFHKHEFPAFRNSDSLTWGDHWRAANDNASYTSRANPRKALN